MRKQTTIIRCDGDGCNTYAEVMDSNETPDGWHRVAAAHGGKLDLKTAFDLCSLRCVEKWAKARRAFLKDTGNGRGAGTRIAILEALADGEPTTAQDLAVLTGYVVSGVRTNLQVLAAEGTVEIVREPGHGGNTEPGLYRIAKVASAT